jgi:hypothetical protein
LVFGSWLSGRECAECLRCTGLEELAEFRFTVSSETRHPDGTPRLYVRFLGSPESKSDDRDPSLRSGLKAKARFARD